MSNIPTLDLHDMANDRATFLYNLREAAHGVGFFYLIGHGIEPQLIEDVMRLSREFFALPMADKLAIEMVKSPHFRGYNRAGGEITRGQPDWREQIDIGAEEEPLYRVDNSPWDRLHGPNQWPTTLPEFKNVMLQYQEEVTALGIRVLRAFAAALGQSEDVFKPIYTPAPTQHLKIIRYPGREAAEGVQGVGAHKDFGFLTILLPEKRGLLVRSDGVNEQWIAAPPVPGAFIINIGEVLEMATNGYLRANIHRVISPPPNTDRLAVAFFLEAKFDAIVPSLMLPPRLAAQSHGAVIDPLNPLFRETGRNYLKSRLRSHPETAQRWHADLLKEEVTT